MVDYVRWPRPNGEWYEFELYPVGAHFYRVSGVYVICQDVGRGQFRQLYVGEAESLADRLNPGPEHHDGYKRALSAGATHISAMLVEPAKRLSVETELRHSLKPPCNAQPIPFNALGMSLFDLYR